MSSLKERSTFTDFYFYFYFLKNILSCLQNFKWKKKWDLVLYQKFYLICTIDTNKSLQKPMTILKFGYVTIIKVTWISFIWIFGIFGIFFFFPSSKEKSLWMIFGMIKVSEICNNNMKQCHQLFIYVCMYTCSFHLSHFL